jgi:uncharacterized protein YjbI with pentapeptide repeats
MKIEIKARITGAVLFTHEAEGNTLRLTLEKAVSLKAYLGGAYLGGAYLGGADLGGAYQRGADLGGADLGGAYLRGADLGGADLRGADLGGADLRGAYLRGAYLGGADLGGAYLGGADLGGADLGGAPIVPNIDAAILAAIEAGGKLDMAQWHTCDTTHCRAGWAITLAGDKGRALEREHGPAVAGALIYAASRPDKPVPNFYASTADAMADIRAGARL